MGRAVWKVDGDVENATSHHAFTAIDLEGEVVLGVVALDGEGGEDGEMADGIEAAGVDRVGEVEAGFFETGLEVGEVIGGADFADAEDIGLFADDDFDESLDFGGVFGPLFFDATFSVDLHGEVVFDVVGDETNGC